MNFVNGIAPSPLVGEGWGEGTFLTTEMSLQNRGKPSTLP